MKARVVKQAEVQEVQIGDNFFYLRPFPAFKSVHMTGELSKLAGPLLAALVPLMDKDSSLDSNISEIIPTISPTFNALSGDNLERIMKELLTNNRNISVDIEGENSPEILTNALADELFCCDTQDMFILAFYVIKYNFSGFFSKLESRFGKAFGKLQSMWENTANSTAADSPT